MIKQTFLIAMLLGAALLAGCDDSGDDDYPYATPGGIYEGTLTDNTTQRQTQVFTIIDEDGNGRMIDDDTGDFYSLSLSNDGLDLSGTLQGYAGGSAFPGGQAQISGNLSGQITDEGLSASFTESNGDSGTLSLSFDYYYYSYSNLPLLAGGWGYSDSGFSLSLSINADGSFNGNSSDGCIYTGYFSIFDSYYNAYHVNYTQTCGNSASNFTGLASYFPDDSLGPEEIELLADNGSGGYLAVPLTLGAPVAQPLSPAQPQSSTQPKPQQWVKSGTSLRPATAVQRR